MNGNIVFSSQRPRQYARLEEGGKLRVPCCGPDQVLPAIPAGCVQHCFEQAVGHLPRDDGSRCVS